MDYRIVWTDPAIADLQEIVSYIFRDDAAAGERVGNDGKMVAVLTVWHGARGIPQIP